MIVYAHLGHWYSLFGFLVPAVLVFCGSAFRPRVSAGRQEFAEYWLLERRDGAGRSSRSRRLRRRGGADALRAPVRSWSPRRGWTRLTRGRDAQPAVQANRKPIAGRFQRPRPRATPGSASRRPRRA